MKKDLQFEELIIKAYSSNDNYLKFKHQLLKVRSIMIKYDDFKNLTAKSQFDFCCTICVIAVQTARHDLTKVKNYGTNFHEDFEYSIYDGFKA